MMPHCLVNLSCVYVGTGLENILSITSRWGCFWELQALTWHAMTCDFLFTLHADLDGTGIHT